MPLTEATAFAPASVGNICVGFDLLGHAIDGPRDLATVRRIDEPLVRIDAIKGDVNGVLLLPLEAERNTAGRALMSLRERHLPDGGFAVSLRKGIPLGSGLGGSAASSVAAVVAANALLDVPLSREALYPFTLDGESVSSGSRHGDNVAPMLLGGIAMASDDRVLSIPVPASLHAVVVHPDQVLETRRSRAVLVEPYPLRTVVEHTVHLAQFIVGLERGDLDLIRAGLRDILVEPRRAPLIPGFAQVKQAALDHGALGASISGGGPSVFAWFASKADAEGAAPAMRSGFTDAGYDARTYVSPVHGPRADLVSA